MLGPNGAHYRGVPLYSVSSCFSYSLETRLFISDFVSQLCSPKLQNKIWNGKPRFKAMLVVLWYNGGKPERVAHCWFNIRAQKSEIMHCKLVQKSKNIHCKKKQGLSLLLYTNVMRQQFNQAIRPNKMTQTENLQLFSSQGRHYALYSSGMD